MTATYPHPSRVTVSGGVTGLQPHGVHMTDALEAAIAAAIARGAGPDALRVDMDDIRRAARRAGSHWFDPESMRFFASRVAQVGYLLPDGGAVFVSSERFECYGTSDHSYHAEPRYYTVRRQMPDGSIGSDIGAFQQYETSAGATRTARAYARKAWTGEPWVPVEPSPDDPVEPVR